MLRNPDGVRAFEGARTRGPAHDEAVSRAVFDAILAEACAVGALPPADPLEGIEADIALARVLHAARPAS